LRQSQAFKQPGIPEKVTVDKSGSNKSALDSCSRELDTENQMEIRQVKYLNNIVEQDHRFIKKRTRPTLGFKNFYSAVATITGIENIRMIQKGQVFGCDSSRSVFHNFCTLMA
jgi:putative transposase